MSCSGQGRVVADDELERLMSAHFPEKTFNVQIQSANIAALLDFLESRHIKDHAFDEKGGDLFSFKFDIRDYYLLEDKTLPESKIIAVSSFKPTLDDLYFKLNKTPSESKV